LKKVKLLLIALFLTGLSVTSIGIPPAQGYDVSREHLSFTLISLAGSQDSISGCDLIKADLEAVGFEINHVTEESSVMYQKIEDYGYYNTSSDYDNDVAPIKEVRPYDLIYMGLSSSLVFPTGLYGLCHTKRDYCGGDNQWGCRNATLDGHLEWLINGTTTTEIKSHCWEAQTILNDIMPFVHVLHQQDAMPNRVGMTGMIGHPTGLVSDGNPFTVLNMHNTTNMPAGRNGTELVMRYFKGVNQGNPDGLLYYEATTARTTFVDSLMWETLVKIDTDTAVIPWLAESFDVADDKMWFDFTLRSGITFQSGNALEPEDVKFSSIIFVIMNLSPFGVVPLSGI